MYNIESDHLVLTMLESIAEQETVDKKILQFILENEDRIFSVVKNELCKAKFISIYWKVAKADSSGQLRSLGVGYSILPLMPGACYEKALAQAISLGSGKQAVGLWKVILLLLCCFGKTLNDNTLETVINEQNLVIRNQVPSSQIAEVTEIFSLAPLYVFLNQVEKTISEVGYYNRYELSKTPCIKKEKPNDILSVLSLAKNEKLSMVRLNSIEEFSAHEYDVILFSSNYKSFHCLVTFSSDFQEKLLNKNPFRVLPVNYLELQNYRAHMDQYFSDDLGHACVKNGMLYDARKYRVSFKVQQPGIERCAMACHSQANQYKLRHEMGKLGLASNNQCIPVDLTDKVKCINYLAANRPCVAWSFNLKDQTCYFSINMSDKELQTGLYEYYEQSGAISAKSGCLPKTNRNPVFINIGNRTIDAKSICLFSPESLLDFPLLTKCPNDFLEVQRPLNSLFEQVSYFKSDFMNLYSKLEARNKRSISTKVFDILKNAALHQGKTILKKLINGIGKNQYELLDRAKNRLKASGFNILLGSNGQEPVELFNYTQMSIYFDKIHELSRTYKINEIQGLIHKLQTEFFRLKTYLSRLMSNSLPLLNSTRNEIQDSKFIFTAYLFEQNIIRHFFISEQLSEFRATSLSVIPINLMNFESLDHYQNGIFTRHEHSNFCLMSILNGKNISQLIDSRICHKNSAVVAINQNLIVMNHTYNLETIKIFSVRNEAFIEVYCPLESHIWTAKKLIIIAVPEVCSLFINKQKVQNEINKISTFTPLILYKLDEVSSLQLSNLLDDFWFLWLFLMGFAGVGLVLAAICVAKTKQLLPTNSYYKVKQPDIELEVQEKEIFEPQEIKKTLKKI